MLFYVFQADRHNSTLLDKKLCDVEWLWSVVIIWYLIFSKKICGTNFPTQQKSYHFFTPQLQESKKLRTSFKHFLLFLMIAPYDSVFFSQIIVSYYHRLYIFAFARSMLELHNSTMVFTGWTDINLLYFPYSTEIASLERLPLWCPEINQSRRPLA